MYEDFFGFSEPPFRLVPDPAYLYLSRSHEEALAHLAYAASRAEGFVVLTGEVGTGKTTLCRVFLETLDNHTEAAFIFNPKLSATQLLRAICDEFGISPVADDNKDLIDGINAFLIAQRSQGKNVILLIDEAQNLGSEVLEQLRLLSNLETTTRKLIQIILVGQPELAQLLQTREMRQLAQRITLSCRLAPLSAKQTAAYVRHRLTIAGSAAGVAFTPGAMNVIQRYSGGIPRLINIACDRALLTAFVDDQRTVTGAIARRAVGELAHSGNGHPFDRGRWRWFVSLAAGLLFALGLGYVVGTAGILPVLGARSPAAPSLKSPAAAPEPGGIAKIREAGSQMSVDGIDTLTAVLAAIDPLNSGSEAVDRVLACWGASPRLSAGSAETGKTDVEQRLRELAGRQGLEVQSIDGGIGQLRQFNLPAVISFERPAGACCGYLALVAGDGEHAQLAGARRTAPLTVEWIRVEAHWNGRAFVAWKDFLAPGEVISPGSSRQAILRLQEMLRQTDGPRIDLTGAYDLPTRRAITALQQRYGLRQDGLVGPMTKIALLNEQQARPVPRLNRPLPSDAISDRTAELRENRQ
jgi:general secretion pathway protein A